MAIVVELLPRASTVGGLPVPVSVVTAGVPTIDGCPVLTRLKSFVVDQGVAATLEHVLRDRTGRPVDVSAYVAEAGTSVSASASSGVGPAGSVVLRVKEFLGDQVGAHNPVYQATGYAPEPFDGVVRAQLPAAAVQLAGLYELNWSVLDGAGNPVLVDRGLLSVERSLFAASLLTAQRAEGPPTLQEIRMRLMDSAANENLLLDDVEFKDEQILLAVAEPIRYWNEAPPPIRRFTTRDFPFRGAWVSGILAQLHLTAATNYRRNRLNHSAGGITVDDKNKEREYLAEGQRLWQEYRAWVQNKKIEINLRLFAGSNVSAYSSRSGW